MVRPIVRHGGFNTWAEVQYEGGGEFWLYFGYGGSESLPFRDVVSLHYSKGWKDGAKWQAEVNWSSLGSTAEPAKVRLFAVMLTLAHELMVAINEGWLAPHDVCTSYGGWTMEQYNLQLRLAPGDR